MGCDHGAQLARARVRRSPDFFAEGSRFSAQVWSAPRMTVRRVACTKEKAPGSGLFSTPSYPGSIVGAEAFHFRVRDGNGWIHLALATRELCSRVMSIRFSVLRPD